MGFVHEHNILGFQWIQGAVHVHQYSLKTTINDGHSHLAQGTTTASNSIIDHFNYYEGKTSFVGHGHQFFGTTGSPVYMQDRTHFHEFSGTTIFDEGHVHYYSGLTEHYILEKAILIEDGYIRKIRVFYFSTEETR